jgi:hypothetical protein
MKNLKKILSVLILGFFAFAPPGTLIIIGIFLLGLLGRAWFIFGVITGVILLIVYVFVNKDKLAKNSCLKTLLQKFKR